MTEAHDIRCGRGAPVRALQPLRLRPEPQALAAEKAQVAWLLTRGERRLGKGHPRHTGMPVSATRIRVPEHPEMGEQRGANRKELLPRELRKRSTLDGHDRPPLVGLISLCP